MSKWVWGRKWFSGRTALFPKLLFLSVYAPIQTLTNQWSGCTTRQHHWLHLSLNKSKEIEEEKKTKQKLFKRQNYLMRFYLLCSLNRIPKLFTIRMLRVVGHCKRILNNSCWQSFFLRVAKSHCFITNLIMFNCLFKSQFKESLTNELLAFFFLFKRNVNFSGTYLLQKVTDNQSKYQSSQGWYCSSRPFSNQGRRKLLFTDSCLLTAEGHEVWGSLLFCGSACPR